MPRERTILKRISGVLNPEKFIVIASEGTRTEYKYFNQLAASEYFNNAGKIELYQIKHPAGLGNPLQLRTQIRAIKRENNFKPTDEFYMVIDTDDWKSFLRKHNHTFDSFIDDSLQQDNVQVLVSNPCFEMWLILHLKKMEELTAEQRELLLLNPTVDDIPYAKQLFSDLIPGNRGYSGTPSPHVFLNRVYDAIANANEITNPRDKYPKQLGSYVHVLVQRIVKPYNS